MAVKVVFFCLLQHKTAHKKVLHSTYAVYNDNAGRLSTPVEKDSVPVFLCTFGMLFSIFYKQLYSSCLASLPLCFQTKC